QQTGVGRRQARGGAGGVAPGVARVGTRPGGDGPGPRAGGGGPLMQDKFYTHAPRRVKPGNQQAFIAAWRAMGDAFLALAGAKSHGTLIQSLNNPTVFYSFGPWESLEQIQAMRADPG